MQEKKANGSDFVTRNTRNSLFFINPNNTHTSISAFERLKLTKTWTLANLGRLLGLKTEPKKQILISYQAQSL